MGSFLGPDIAQCITRVHTPRKQSFGANITRTADMICQSRFPGNRMRACSASELAFFEVPTYTGRASSSSMTRLSITPNVASCRPCSAMMMLICSWQAAVLRLWTRCAADAACWGWLNGLKGWSRSRRAGQVTSLVATATTLRSGAVNAPATEDDVHDGCFCTMMVACCQS